MEEENINSQLSLLILWIITLVRMKIAYFSQWKIIALLYLYCADSLAFLFYVYFFVINR